MPPKDSASFNVGLLNRNYAQTGEVIRDEEGSGWLVETPKIPLDTLRQIHQLESQPEHVSRLESLSDGIHVDAWRSVVSALAEGEERHVKAAEKIYLTHSRPVMALRRADGRTGIIAGTTRDRLNPMQMLETAGKYQHSYAAVVAEAQVKNPKARFSLLTLTLRHWQGLPLKCSLAIATQAFSALTRSALWKRSVTNFVRGVETPWSEANGWHVHVHAFLQAGFIDLGDLWKLWIDRVTKAARKERKKQLAEVERWRNAGMKGPKPFVLSLEECEAIAPEIQGVDLREASNATEAVGYVAKMELLKELPAAQIRELHDALKHRKLIRGSAHWGERAKILWGQHLREARRKELEEGTRRISIRDAAEEIRHGDNAEDVLEIARALWAVGFRWHAAKLASKLYFLEINGAVERPPEPPTWWPLGKRFTEAHLTQDINQLRRYDWQQEIA